MKRIFFLAIVFLGNTLLFGQTDEKKNPDFPFIEVTGHAESSVVPDEITINITMKERFKNKEKVTIRQQEDSLKYYIVKEGLDLNNLTLSDANSDYVQVNWSKKQVMTQANYLYKASDAVQVAKIFQIAEKFLFYDASILKVNYSKREELRNEMRINAMKNAKGKADDMLNAIGFQTGKAWIVLDNSTNNTTVTREEYQCMASKDINSVAATNAGVYQSDGSWNTTVYYTPPKEEPVDPYSVIAKRHDLGFSKVKIQSTVYIKYEIK